MNRLIPVNSVDDILPAYRDTPIGRLLEYHNLGRPLEN
jgi:carbonic anhydrase